MLALASVSSLKVCLERSYTVGVVGPELPSVESTDGTLSGGMLTLRLLDKPELSEKPGGSLPGSGVRDSHCFKIGPSLPFVEAPEARYL